MLSASSSNNHSLFSFSRNGESTQTASDSTGSFDFLPSVSFDDLQTSLESASTEFALTQFPSPTGAGSILDRQTATRDNIMHEKANITQPINGASRVAVPTGTRPGRSGSILRRPSTSSRQPSVSSVKSSTSGIMEPPRTSTTTVRTAARRQSHHPPVSSVNSAKQPRKSIGPGVLGDASSDTFASAQRRRPSLSADRGDTSRTSIDTSGVSLVPSMSRAMKAKSVQPLQHSSHGGMSLGDNLAPESNRASTLTPRSPRTGGQLSTPSSSARRASMMPGSHHSNHAHGLGARTISPTDTRRAKRLSTMPPSQNLSQVPTSVPPPPPVSMDNRIERPDSKSPSMIPRKASGTPSSARTTPDVNMNRKSYSSGLSIGSNLSYNTVRTSIGSSAQPRIPQSSSSSRLPAPKHVTMHNTMPAEDEEFVPPVPAIPKAYESPGGSPASSLFMDKRQVLLSGNDATSIHSTSQGSIHMPVQPEPSKISRRPSHRKSSYLPAATKDDDKSSASSSHRKNLQPLSLPPLNLGPLNIPVGKSLSMREPTTVNRNVSPPPSRQIPKTPSTPMTASRSTFFSKSRYDDTVELPVLRSSSSIHMLHHAAETPPPLANSPDSSLIFKESDFKPSLSPFLSSSAPKAGGFDHTFLKRSKTGEDLNVTAPIPQERTQQKPAGPRAPKSEKPKSPTPGPSAEEPDTPSSMTSLRRKLSLSWKRGHSKTATSGTTGSSDSNEKGHAQSQQQRQQPPTPSHQPAVVRQDSMPPPRIPVSATVNNLSSKKQASPTPTVKSTGGGGYLESRRRKSSAAAMGNFVSHDRTKSDTWGTGKKETPDSSTMPTARNPSVMHKFLKSRTSSNPSARTSTDAWTADLDKDDLAAEEEMRKLGSRRKETDIAARTIDALRKRATPKERVGPHEAIRIAMLNIYERGEIIDYNDIYFCGTQKAQKVVGDLHSDAPNFGYDDERGDYTIVTGDHLAFRYEIVDVLGKGSFGQVVRCIDHKLGVLVAVKIIRNKKRFHQQALVEVNILQKLREWDQNSKHSMVRFTQSFYFRGHLCISTELLDMNLYELIKAHQFRGFSLRIIRRFTKQILSSLNLLSHKKVIHCDLKPENILLRHPLHSEIKVIDFGSSCFETEKVYTYIQSRFYRSPEVILGMTYGMPIDMWSVGCILAELYTGVPIFPGENEQEQLACIMEVFGPPEKHLIEKSTRKKLFFDSMGKPRLTVSSKGRRRRPSSKTLQQVLKCDDEPFLDFIARCLRWDPDRRMKPEEAIRHEFITGKKQVPLRIASREASPVKRHNTISVTRPLPEPPSGGVKIGNTMRSGQSPHKPVSGTARRISGATAPTTASTMKRASTNTSASGISMGTSSLPRIAGRTASGSIVKSDLAAAGATVAMGRKG
ncbi:unnamed protein product [Clonostachys chloroleuca]|uniref:dual-specificity kinase n=1 Tax=Clonostachys chloroleuca TaxID=1926264 RepID=A0AA35QEN4_9HYPO|nr:unnamed protein product [Clonostachys chloroleuca]